MWFWLVAFWGAREVLGLVGEKGSEEVCFQPPNVETLLIKTSSIRIVGSYIRVTGGQIPVCLVTLFLPL